MKALIAVQQRHTHTHQHPGLETCCCAWQVAERSLFLWNNEYIVSLVAQQRTAVLPLVFAALERNERSHWNPQVCPPSLQLVKACRKRAECMEGPPWCMGTAWFGN